MSTTTLPNIRVSSDLTVRVRLKDGGVAIDWSTLNNIKAHIYSDAQRALAGRCDVSVDADDSTLLVCNYAANKPQYVGINRIVVSAKYMGETKTYDKPAFNFVRWTADQEGEEITIDDPDVDVEIEVEDVTSSILQEAIDAALQAAADAEHAAHLVPLEVLQDCEQATADAIIATAAANAAGIDEVQATVDAQVGTPSVDVDLENKVLSMDFHNMKGETGEAAGFGTASASLTEDGGDPSVTVSASGPDTAKQFAFTFKNLKGDKGDKGDQGNTGSSVEYPYELVNNLTTNDATKGLTAAMGVTLEGEVSQLEAEVHQLSGKFYGVFADDSDLPEGDGVGYAFVGANEPFAIWNFDGTSWSDSGSEAIGLQGPQGNSGYTGAAGELEVVNNLEDGGATAALSAEMGKLLSRNMKLLYDSMGAAAFWGEKPVIDWSGNTVPVSLTLTDCTIDNLASNVPLGDSYEATITPDAGNILGPVVCTMNGEPQTVVNGYIYIAEVTGSIVISAAGINLDSVAYESLTYKQIFETNNWLGINPGFENGSYSPLTVNAGSPSVQSSVKDSGDYALDVSGTSSQQLITSGYTGSKGFLACRVKITSYTAGSVGILMGSQSASLGAVSDWTTKVFRRTATTNNQAFVGSFSSANLTGYMDTPVVVLDSVFGTVPTEAKFTELYENYVAIKKAS